MIPLDSQSRLFEIITILGIEIIDSFAVLDPAIKSFIGMVAIFGPLSIASLILLLKKIEKDNPDRIRWK